MVQLVRVGRFFAFLALRYINISKTSASLFTQSSFKILKCIYICENTINSHS